MPNPILYTILHHYAFHQFVLKILIYHGRNSIIGKVNSRLYFDEILHDNDIDKV